MVYNYKKQRSPIVPMYTILDTSDDVPEKNGDVTRSSKQQIRKIEDTPGPGTYNTTDLDVYKDKAPHYSIMSAWRHSYLIYAPCYWSPGPQYNPDPRIFKDKVPHYSMTNRNYMPGDNNRVPGPGAYSPEHVRINKRAAPKFSFGIRHFQRAAPIIVDVQD